jgi:DNA-binding MarR family transcriptional regulator
MPSSAASCAVGRRTRIALVDQDLSVTGEGQRPAVPGDNVLLQSFRTAHALRAVLSRAGAGTGISADEYAVLGVINLLGPVSPTELSRRLSVPPTTISRFLAGFVKGGLAKREANPDDGRSYLVRTTPKGRRVVRTIAPRIRDLLADLHEASAMPLDDITDALVALEHAAWAAEGRHKETTVR